MDRAETAVKKIDELLEAIAREQNKPFTGIAISAREALALVRKILVD